MKYLIWFCGKLDIETRNELAGYMGLAFVIGWAVGLGMGLLIGEGII